jgi:hypothetical protein
LRTGDTRLVTIKTYFDRLEAEFAKSLLEAYDVESLIAADDCGGMRPYLGIGSGGARLLVREEDAERALKLLEARPDAQG